MNYAKPDLNMLNIKHNIQLGLFDSVLIPSVYGAKQVGCSVLGDTKIILSHKYKNYDYRLNKSLVPMVQPYL